MWTPVAERTWAVHVRTRHRVYHSGTTVWEGEGQGTGGGGQSWTKTNNLLIPNSLIVSSTAAHESRLIQTAVPAVSFTQWSQWTCWWSQTKHRSGKQHIFLTGHFHDSIAFHVTEFTLRVFFLCKRTKEGEHHYLPEAWQCINNSQRSVVVVFAFIRQSTWSRN